MMEKKITLEENQPIEINGVVLTVNAINTLREFQDNDNEDIQHLMLNPLSNVICLFAKNIDYCSHDKEEIIVLMNQLAWMRENIKALMKP